VAAGERDHLAEETFVYAAEDLGFHHGKLIRALRVVKPVDDDLERLVVDVERGRERVGRFVPVLFLEKVKETGVVAFVGALEERDEARIGAFAF
jgi:hypothetical protein